MMMEGVVSVGGRSAGDYLGLSLLLHQGRCSLAFGRTLHSLRGLACQQSDVNISELSHGKE